MQTRVLCVLGMHRSGTSCLAGTLEEAGVYLGEVVRQARFNARGNRENRQIMALHDNVLAASGGSWDDPREPVCWGPRHRALQREIIRQYAGHKLWGFKDPRTLFTLDAWLEELPHLLFVGTYRHPLAVARSLEHRNQFSIAKGLDLWTRYNRKLLAYHQRHHFPMISFDVDEECWRRQVVDLLAHWGLERRPGEIQFFDPDLRHQQAAEDYELPADVYAMYQQLNRVAEQTREAA